MSRALKASLLSALVLPGAGHLYLRRYLRGLVLAALALAALWFVLAETLAVATGRAADLLPALDRRAGSYSDPAQAVPAVLRAARWAATRVDDADAAMRYVRKATSLAHGDAEALR